MTNGNDIKHVNNGKRIWFHSYMNFIIHREFNIVTSIAKKQIQIYISHHRLLIQIRSRFRRYFPLHCQTLLPKHLIHRSRDQNLYDRL